MKPLLLVLFAPLMFYAVIYGICFALMLCSFVASKSRRWYQRFKVRTTAQGIAQ